ncbi:MAG: putative Ig domain-containing protein [Akkermansiaceae bacterium]|jgi:hypothetical protein|nr:putative Ig domain-containing protein [Akkermansiaceae bacterium]
MHLRSLGRILPAFLAMAGMLGDVVKGQTQNFEVTLSETITIDGQIDIAATRPAELELAETPLTVEGTNASAIVQDTILGSPWYNIEREVVQALLDLYELPANQRSRLLRWERGLVRAALWNRVLMMLKKSPAERTSDEQAVVDQLTVLFKQMRIDCAQISVNEYNRWNFAPNLFVPETPFTYERPPPSNLSAYYLFGGPKPPSFEEFQAYGPLIYYRRKPHANAFEKVAKEAGTRGEQLLNTLLAENIQAAASQTAGTVVGVAVGVALGTQLATTAAAQALINTVAPFAARVGGQAVSAATGTLAGSVIGVVIFAVVTSVFEGIAVTNAAALPGKLQEALNNAKNLQVDLRALTGAAVDQKTDSQIRALQELYGIFITLTLPDFGATEQAPPAVADDAKWLTAAPDSSVFQSTPTIQLLNAAGEKLSVRLLDGWFVVRDGTGNERLTLSFDYLDDKGVQRTITRKGSRVIITDPGTATGAELTEVFRHMDWNRQAWQSRFGSGGVPASITPSSLPDVKVGDAVNLPFQISNPGAGAYTYSIVSPSLLPTGLSLSSSGVLSGVARSPGSFVFHIHAVNSIAPFKPAQVRVNLRIAGSVAAEPSGMLASYRFEGNPDDSKGTLHGTWSSGTAGYVPGFIGQAASFSPAAGNWIELPADVFPRPIATTPRSFEVWFRTTAHGPILGQRSPDDTGFVPALYVGTNGNLFGNFFWRGTTQSLQSTTAVNDGRWHHVAATFDGTTQRIYLDGALMAQAIPSLEYGTQTYRYSIGRAISTGWPNITQSIFQGDIDEAAIYNRELTLSEVSAIHQAGPNGRATLTLGNLTATTLPVGRPASITIPVSDGGLNVLLPEISVVSGSLPPGLIVSNNTLVGTPRVAGSFTFGLQARSSTGHPGIRTYTITVTGPVRPFLTDAVAWWKCDTASLSTANPSQPVFTSLVPGSPTLGNVNIASIGSGWVGESYGNASISPPASAFLTLAPGAIPTQGAEFTFETWFLAKGHGSLLQRVRGASVEPVIWIGHDGLLRAHAAWSPTTRTTLSSRQRIDDSSWHHVALTFRNKQHQLYIDGELVGIAGGLQSGPGTPLFDTTASYRIGGGPVSNSWAGITTSGQPPVIAIDETGIYSRELSAAEVVGINLSGSNGKSRFDLTPATLPKADFNNYYRQIVTAPQAVGAVTWAIGEGTLPPGLVLQTSGNEARIVGQLTSARGSTFTLVATDSTGASGSRQYTLLTDGSPSAILPGITGLWKGERNYLDSAGTRHASAVLGNPVFTDVETGSAFLFNNTGGSLRIPTSSFPPLVRTPTIFDPARSNAPYSFEAWFVTNKAGIILGRHNVPYFLPPIQSTPALYVGTDGRLYSPMFSVAGGTTIVSGSRVDDSRFHHVVVTYDGSNRRTYLNGTLLGAVTGHTSEFNGVTDVLEIGIGYNGGGANWPALPTGWTNFSGIIDEVAVYNRMLTDAEVSERFAAGSFGASTTARVTVQLPAADVDAEYAASLFTLSQGKSFVSGAVPPGLTLRPDGTLSGTPTSAGSYTLDVSTLLSGNTWQLRRFLLRVNAPTAPRTSLEHWYQGEGDLDGFVAVQQVVSFGNVSFTTGRVGQAFRLNGGRLGVVGPSTLPGQPWSFETWFRTTRAGVIMSGNAGGSGPATAMLAVLSDGRLRFQPTNSTAAGMVMATTTLVDDNQFHHVAITSGPEGYRFYLDGRLAEVTTTNIPSVSTPEVGRILGGGGFVGEIDEPQILAFPISADAVRRIYAAGDLGKSVLIMNTGLPAAQVGQPYQFTLSTNGATAPYTYRVSDGRLPKGISLSSNGTLSGTPLNSGPHDVTIEAVSQDNRYGSETYRLTVNPGIRFRGADLTAWWSGENHANDWSGGIGADLTGTVAYAAGMRGQAFSFDGSTATRLEIPESAFIQTSEDDPFTFETWFKARSPGALASRHDPFGLFSLPLVYIGLDGKLRAQTDFGVLPEFVESPDAVIDGNWHHIALSCENGEVTVTLDGTVIGTGTSFYPLLAPGESILLGYAEAEAWPLSGDEGAGIGFDGLIDEPAVWARKLGPTDIGYLIACGPNGKADARFSPSGRLPDATRGRPYQQILAVDDPLSPAITLAGGNPPSRLTLPTASGGSIAGTSSTAGIFNFLLRSQSTTGSLAEQQRIEERFQLEIDALTNSASYDLWVGAAPLTGAAALPSGSLPGGLPNLLRYAFNLAPGQGSQSTLIPGTGTSGLPWSGKDAQGRLVIEFVRRKASSNPGITYSVETGTSLGALNPLSLTGATITSINATWERVRITDPTPTPTRFGRVRVSGL